MTAPTPGPSQAYLADAACRRWLKGAILPNVEARPSVADALADSQSVEDLFEVA